MSYGNLFILQVYYFSTESTPLAPLMSENSSNANNVKYFSRTGPDVVVLEYCTNTS